MKYSRLFSLSLMVLVSTILFGTHSISAQTKTLKFGDDGKFKIVQFTDVHWRYGDTKSEEAAKRMAEVLDAEKPDLVIFTSALVRTRILKGSTTQTV